MNICKCYSHKLADPLVRQCKLLPHPCPSPRATVLFVPIHEVITTLHYCWSVNKKQDSTVRQNKVILKLANQTYIGWLQIGGGGICCDFTTHAGFPRRDDGEIGKESYEPQIKCNDVITNYYVDMTKTNEQTKTPIKSIHKLSNDQIPFKDRGNTKSLAILWALLALMVH